MSKQIKMINHYLLAQWKLYLQKLFMCSEKKMLGGELLDFR